MLFFLRSVFKSITALNQIFWLNLIPLWSFFETKPWFNGCIKFLMWITNSVLSFTLTSFLLFSIFILSGKIGKSLRSSCNFLRYWPSTPRKNPSSLSSLWFFIKPFLIWEVRLSIQNYLLEAFVTLPNRMNCLHPNIEDMTILYFYHNLFMNLLLAFACQ